jgi:hypothetical protein
MERYTTGQSKTTFDVPSILERSGFRIRCRRADCPFCEGHSRLTVAIRSELYFCHRCHRGGSVRSLARRQGLSLPAPRIKKANLPKARFRAWLSAKMIEMGNTERRLYRRAQFAQAALSDFSDMEAAWAVLAECYDRERDFEIFWERATDKIGRYWLYRQWRKQYAAQR